MSAYKTVLLDKTIRPYEIQAGQKRRVEVEVGRFGQRKAKEDGNWEPGRRGAQVISLEAHAAQAATLQICPDLRFLAFTITHPREISVTSLIRQQAINTTVQ